MSVYSSRDRPIARAKKIAAQKFRESEICTPGDSYLAGGGFCEYLWELLELFMVDFACQIASMLAHTSITTPHGHLPPPPITGLYHLDYDHGNYDGCRYDNQTFNQSLHPRALALRLLHGTSSP